MFEDEMIKRTLRRFSIFDLLVMAFCAALGVAVKPAISALTHIITGPLMIPGGAFSGGLYMMFIILGAGIVRKPGAATLICAIQALMVIISPFSGSHGIFSLVTYGLPGVAVDLLWLAMRGEQPESLLSCFAGCILANIVGVVTVNAVFFRLPLFYLLLTSALGAISGGVGGIISYNVINRLRKRLDI
jgi:ABC-type thiamin/hydroxymethylpyrimidine transport system permease subunit